MQLEENSALSKKTLQQEYDLQRVWREQLLIKIQIWMNKHVPYPIYLCMQLTDFFRM